MGYLHFEDARDVDSDLVKMDALTLDVDRGKECKKSSWESEISGDGSKGG